MNAPAMIGHNRGPDPIDEAVAPFGDAISEAANWLDGSPVETEEQMRAVDEITAQIRSARSAVDKARKAATDPLHKAWKEEVARWKPTEDDLDRLQKGLAAIVDAFKRRLAAEKAEAERKARAEAEAAMRAARAAAEAADVANIEAQRAADAARREAEEAVARAKEAAKDTVKGMRQTWFYEITDHRDALHWIAKNDRDAVTRFVEEYVRAHHKQRPIEGVRTWQEKVAV